MRKFAKLSLVAAVAVAGFTTTATAGALEDAIKNTSILGYATYRYDDRTIDNESWAQSVANKTTGNNDAYNRHKIAVGLISKVTNDISYTYVGAVAEGSNTSTESVDYMNGQLFTVYNYFTYTGLQNVAINVGQQTIDTPQTDTYDDIASTQEGTGITAAATFGDVTLVAGGMNQTKLTGEGVADLGLGDNDLYVVAALAKVAGVSVDANYINIKDSVDSFTVGAKTSFDVSGVKLSPYARYTGTDATDAGLADNGLWYVGSKAQLGALGFDASYTKTAQDGGFVAFDDDAEAVNQSWALNLNDDGLKGHMYKVGATYAITPAYIAGLNYAAMEQDNVDFDETYGQLTWKPSKNFYAYARYGVVSADNAEDAQRGRLQFTYTF